MMSSSLSHSQTAFKGIELYSWLPRGTEWHFSLLVGTNRNKSIEEITDPTLAVAGVIELKAALAKLPKGEQIFWKNLATEPVPGEIILELERFSRQRDINLHRFSQ